MSPRRDLTENALLFGRGRNLVGVVTRPSQVRPDLPAVLLLNAGSIHRVGPNRIYVRAARSIAARGRLVCRFDFAGLGDSVAAGDGAAMAGGFEDRAAHEAGQVMDDLAERFGVEKFILVGMCSGADVGYRHACRDARVAGAVLVNGHLVPDSVLRSVFAQAKARATLRRHRKKLTSADSWRRLLTGKSATWKVVASASRWVASLPSAVAEGLVGGRIWPAVAAQFAGKPSPQDVVAGVATGFTELAARPAKISLVYSDGSVALDVFRLTLRAPLRDVVRSRGVDLRIVRGTDHVFSSLTSQRQLLSLITEGVEVP